MEQLESLFDQLTKNTVFLIQYNDATPHHKVTINSSIKEQIQFYLQVFNDKRKIWQFEDLVFDVSSLPSSLTFQHIGMIPSFLQNESIIKLKSVDPIFTIIVNHDDKTLFEFEHFLHPIDADCTTVKKLVYDELSNKKMTNYTVESVMTADKKIWDEIYSLSELRVWDSPKIIYANLKTVIYPAQKDQQDITIVVKFYTGKMQLLNIKPDHPLTILTQMFEDQENISIYDQRLIFGGKCLELHNTLSYYNIREGSTIYLLQSLPRRRLYNRQDPALLLNPNYCSIFHKRMKMSAKDYNLLQEINEKLEEGSVEKNLAELLLKL